MSEFFSTKLDSSREQINSTLTVKRLSLIVPLACLILLLVGLSMYVALTQKYIPGLSEVLLFTRLINSYTQTKGDFVVSSERGQNFFGKDRLVFIGGKVEGITDNGLFLTKDGREYFVQFSLPQERILVSQQDVKITSTVKADKLPTVANFLKLGMTVEVLLDQTEIGEDLSTHRIMYVKED